MAGVFIMTASTISLRTRVMPGWLAILGYVTAEVLLLTIGSADWASVVFPVWVFIISVGILIRRFREQSLN